MTRAFPVWLNDLSAASLAVGLACALVIAIDETRHPQKMWVMNLVWPLCALFGGLLWLAGYWRWGRAGVDGEAPMAVAVAKASSHCGAGCTLGDLTAEWLAFAAPGVAVAFGWKSLFAEKTFAVWGLDFLLAYLLGIGFQYFTIAPMRDLSIRKGLLAALKADTASIASWQMGMYGAIALIQFAWFRPAYGALAPVDSTPFWFAMQVAMLCGFAASYPVNWALVALGAKEKM